MIDGKATAIDLALPGQLQATNVTSRIINLPGTNSDPRNRSGIEVVEQVRRPGIVTQVAVGVLVLAVIGNAAMQFKIQMVTPLGTFIDLFESETINSEGSLNILFDPDSGPGVGPPDGFDSIEDQFIAFPTLRVSVDVTGTGSAAIFYKMWLECS